MSRNGKIYFGVGTVTNSGVVGLDNVIAFLLLAMWPDLHDVPAKDIELTGQTFITQWPPMQMWDSHVGQWAHKTEADGVS